MKKHLIPREGVKVRDPQTGGIIPAAGVNRMVTTYLMRRINDGDLVVKDSPKVSGKKTTKAPKESK